MIDKNRPEIKFVSPVSGEVTAVNRGEKRKVLSIVVKPDAQIEYEEFGKKNVSSYRGRGERGTSECRYVAVYQATPIRYHRRSIRYSA